MSCSRDQMVCTGAPPASRAIAAAWETKSTSSRRPKPPPSNCTCTSIFSGAMPSTLAAWLRAIPGTWVETHTVAAPSLNCTVQFIGSITACAR
jgi:hypothetical protein